MVRTLLIAVFLFAASAAFGQIGNVSSIPHYGNQANHEQHAYQHGVRQEQNLQGNNTAIVGQGERPLWEFYKPEAEVPLGTVAREYREQHKAEPKAVIKIEN